MQKKGTHIAHEELMEVLDRVADGFFAVDHQWQIIFVNRSLEQTLAIRRESVLYRTLWEVYPHLKDTAFERHCSDALRNHTSAGFEHYSIRQQRWFEVTAHPSTTGLSVLLRDITERKQLEEELRLLSLVAKETENAVIILDLEQKITWVNAAFTRMTGYSFEEAVGQQPSILLMGPDTHTQEAYAISEQLKKNLPVQTEIRNYKKNGEPFWSELSIQPLFDAHGQVEQYFSIRKEITLRKELESERAGQQKKIAAAVLQAQEAERTAVGRELHDNVNQVLTTAKLYTEICAVSPEQAGVFLPKCTALLIQSINEIRRLSKQLAAPALGSVGLRESLSELVDSIRLTQQLDIRFAIPSYSCTAVADELQLATYRIAQEHLTNILKHAEASLVTVTLSCSEEALTLTITDNGVGFDSTLKPKGIGITNMYSRAALLNGVLTIKSQKGKGCTLFLWFPVTCCDDKCSSLTPTTSGVALTGKAGASRGEG